jgi:hypothetical protein
MRHTLTLSIALTLVVAACGGDGAAETTAESTATTGETPTTATITLATTPTTTLAPTTTTSTPAPTTTAVTAPSESAYSTGWVFSEGIGGAWPAYSESMQVVVVGFASELRSSVDVSTWSSADPDGDLMADAGWVDKVTATSFGFIAQGRTCEGGGDFDHEPFPCPQRPGMWLSTDAASWEMVSDGTAFAPCTPEEMCHASIEWVSETPEGLVAHGYDEAGVAAWASPDGRTWTRHDLVVPEDCCDPLNILKVWLVDRFIGTETIVSYDENCECPIGVDTYVYESLDGLTWRLLDTADMFTGVEVSATAARDNVLVALGSRSELGVEQQTTWTTTDGHVWVEAPLPDASGDFGPKRLFVVSDGWLMISRVTRPAYGGPTNLLMWHSPDGIEWTSISVDPTLSRDPGVRNGYESFRSGVLGPDGTILTQDWIWRP